VKPPEALQFRKEDFPSGLSTPPALDGLFVPLNRFIAATRKCLAQGVGVNDNCAFEVRTVRITTPATDWVTPALLNSWADNAGGGEVPGYRKDAAGKVWGRGHVKNGTLGLAAFTLDSKYFPAGLKILPAVANNAGTFAAGELRISAAGSVTPFSGATTFFSLDAMEFDAADRTPVPLSCWPVDVELRRVTNPLGVTLLSVRDVTNPQASAATEPPLALGELKTVPVSATRVRLQNLPGLLLGRNYDVTFCAWV